MKIYESGEMYLETILELKNKIGNVRAIDIADALGYSKPSVSRALNVLKKGEFIEVDGSGFIVLTPSGQTHAEKIYERHTTLTRLLISLGVSEEVAVDDACRLEHAISDESMLAIKKFLENK